MDAPNVVRQHFEESIKIKEQSLNTLSGIVATAGETIHAALLQGNKILTCGNGGSASHASHFAAEMINRFEMVRPALPAIALTTDTTLITSISNDLSYDQIFERQIRAIGAAGDILLVFTSSGNSANLLPAISAAHDRDLTVIALTGKDGGNLASSIDDKGLEIRVPSINTARIQETHLVIIHSVCDLIDKLLFGGAP